MNIVYDQNMPLGKELFTRLGKATAVDGRTLTAKQLKKADALFLRSTCKINAELIEGTPVKFVGSGVVGTDHIDFDALRRAGIPCATAPGCNAESVANYVIAALLVIGERQGRTWEGATLGIVGVGHVGSIVKRFAEEALGMKTLCCDPPRQDDGDYRARDFVSYETLLQQADVITFHTPLNETGPYKTRGYFSGPIVRKVKPGAVLLNFARGPICDSALVATMLGAGLLSDAAIDCWEGEPDYAPELAAIAALTTPHIAGHAYEGKADGTWMVYEAACDFFDLPVGEKPDYPPPSVPLLTLDGTGKTDEQLLREAVKATCDIEADTLRFRQSYSNDVTLRCQRFDELRKTVAHRRHFSATSIVLTHPTPTIEAKLKALGFVIVPASKKPAPKKKMPAKKPVAKKTAPAKKPAAKKPTAKKKTTAKKAVVRKAK